MNAVESKQHLEARLAQIAEAIFLCIERKLVTPSLILIFSAIDITSWLDDEDPKESVKTRFTRWVDRYLLPAKPLQCTAIELYAARCGLVHTLTPESNLTKQENVRQIIYAWGTSKADKLQEMITLGQISKYVSLHIEELLKAYLLGLATFLEEVSNNPSKAAKVYAKSDKFFGTLTEEHADALLRTAKALLEDS